MATTFVKLDINNKSGDLLDNQIFKMASIRPDQLIDLYFDIELSIMDDAADDSEYVRIQFKPDDIFTKVSIFFQNFSKIIEKKNFLIKNLYYSINIQDTTSELLCISMFFYAFNNFKNKIENIHIFFKNSNVSCLKSLEYVLGIIRIENIRIYFFSYSEDYMDTTFHSINYDTSTKILIHYIKILDEKNDINYQDMLLISESVPEYENYNNFEVEIITTTTNTETIEGLPNNIPQKIINFSKYTINQNFSNKYELEYTIVVAKDNDIIRSQILIADVTFMNTTNLCELNNLVNKMKPTTLITNFTNINECRKFIRKIQYSNVKIINGSLKTINSHN